MKYKIYTKKFDYELIAFRNKKSAWKFILNEVDFYNETMNGKYESEGVLHFFTKSTSSCKR